MRIYVNVLEVKTLRPPRCIISSSIINNTSLLKKKGVKFTLPTLQTTLLLYYYNVSCNYQLLDYQTYPPLYFEFSK